MFHTAHELSDESVSYVPGATEYRVQLAARAAGLAVWQVYVVNEKGEWQLLAWGEEAPYAYGGQMHFKQLLEVIRHLHTAVARHVEPF